MKQSPKRFFKMATNCFVNVTDAVLKYETYFCHFSPMTM